MRKERGAMIGLFALALAVRLLALVVFPGHGDIQDDAVDYDRLARNLLAGHNYSLSEQPPYEPTMARDPLYPFVLAAVYAVGGGNVTVALVVQAILGAFTPLLVYGLCREMAQAALALPPSPPSSLPPSWGRAWAGCWLAAVLTALYQVLVVSSGYVLTEWLATLLLTAALFLFARAYLSGQMRWAAAAGAALGLLALARATMQLLPLGLAALLLAGWGLYRLARRPSWLREFRFSFRVVWPLLAGFVLTVLPWALRNQVTFGTWQLGGRSGQALWARTLNLPTMRYDKGPAVALAQQERQRRQAQGLTYEEIDRQMQAEALAAIRQYPLSYLAQNLREVSRMWITTYSSDFDLDLPFGDYLAQGNIPAVAVKLLLIGLNFATLSLALLGALARLRHWTLWWPLGVAILYVTGVYSFFWALPRYGVLLYPTVLVFVAWGLAAGAHLGGMVWRMRVH